MLTGPLPKLVDHAKLAEQRAELDGLIPVAQLTRLKELLAGDGGDVRVKLRFRQEKKHRTLVLGECSAKLEVTCQACLEPLQIRVAAKIRTILVPDIEELMTLRQHEDGLVCESGQVAPVDLVEDDLIVAMPMVPRHEEGECDAIGPVAEPAGETHRPFAALAKLTEEFKGS